MMKLGVKDRHQSLVSSFNSLFKDVPQRCWSAVTMVDLYIQEDAVK